MTSLLHSDEEILYPSGDGQPMAESTEQYRWIVMVKENLEILFKDDPNVFIAGDLLWYPEPVEVPPAPSQAPDVMVAWGRPKGMRFSYKQWEEDNVAPQVVFEILSRSNRTRRGREAMAVKFRFYESYGVEEYYIYDPDKLTLQGWQRQGNTLVEIPQMSDWVSPRLGIRFVWQPRQPLTLLRPDGSRFLSSIELAEQAERAQQAMLDAVPRLRAMGLSVEQIAASLGLAIATVETCLGGPQPLETPHETN
jgi:Uma2 family endonuclease